MFKSGFHGFVMVCVVLLLSGCGIAPTIRRSEPPAVSQGSRADARTLAGKIDATGPRGRLSRAEREQMIVRLGQQGGASLLQRHLAAMAAFGDLDLITGNQGRLLVDGPAAFEAMFASIERAKRSVLLESYIIDDAAIARKLAALLAKKRAEGVLVAVLYDDVGSIGTGEDFFSGLRSAGILVCAFNPVRPGHADGRTGYWDISHRDHRKILVVDGEWGFTGGINISAVYSSGSFGRRKANPELEIKRREGWRDTQVQLHGPAATVLDNLVRETWATQKCEGDLPDLQSRAGHQGQDVVRIIPVTPDDQVNRIYALLLTSIDASQKSVYLTMAYFAPGEDMIDALCDAALRGVDVQLILPSVSDFSPVLLAGQSYYQRMLDAGVKIHELQTAILHAKTAVIDGVVSTVGSSNMDWRSFASNNEVNAVIMGEDFGDAMRRMFMLDVNASRTLTAAQWASRPFWQRVKEGAARMFEKVF